MRWEMILRDSLDESIVVVLCLLIVASEGIGDGWDVDFLNFLESIMNKANIVRIQQSIRSMQDLPTYYSKLVADLPEELKTIDVKGDVEDELDDR
jgi:hypothetical protein